MSSTQLSENGFHLSTGEENNKNNILGLQDEKRTFVSLTDNFDIAATKYAQFPFDESIEYSKELFGKDIRSDENIPILICFNGNDIKQKYSESLVNVKSDLTEIGINSSISPSDIKCIITSYDKIEYVKSIASQYGISVLGYDNNDKYEKRFYDKEGKFYSSNMEVDEQEFERTKERLKVRKMNQTDLNSGNKNNANQSVEHLSVNQSMMIASDIKMDIVFNLTEQYNSGIPFKPLTADDLITKYNINENVAQKLALEVNIMLENYIREKEYEMNNHTPYVLDEFEEEPKSTGVKRR